MSNSLGNYEPIDLPPRTGPGEGGKIKFKYHRIEFYSSSIHIAVPVILSPSEEQEAQRTIGEYGFNMVASDKISMDRRFNDTGPDE
jgi:hypothetical protein